MWNIDLFLHFQLPKSCIFILTYTICASCNLDVNSNQGGNQPSSNQPSGNQPGGQDFNPGGSQSGQGSNIDTATYQFSTTLDTSLFKKSTVTVPSVDETSFDEPAKMTLTGSLSSAQSIEVTQKTLVTLNNLTLDSTKKGISISGSGDVYIKVVGTNTITSVKNAIDADDLEGNLYFFGEGALSITSSTSNGIKAKKSQITIYSGEYAISLPSASGGDGIKCSNFTMYSGELTINALGELVKASYEDYPGSKGLQAKAVTGSSDGNITIYGGEINILSYGKALTANYGDYSTASTCGNVVINNGYITARTTGTPVDDTSTTIEDGISPEGIEAKNTLTINGGLIQVCSTDDSLNGLQTINITGGYIFGLSTKNDCIDSNNNISVSGGILIALSTTGGAEKAIDTDLGENPSSKFVYKDGTIVAISKNSSDAPTNTSNYLSQSVNISSTFSVQNSSKELVRYCTPSGTGFGNSANVLVCNKNITKSSSTIKNTSSAVSATNNFNGLDLSL